MPNPTQIRNQRIEELIQRFQSFNIDTIDTILAYAFERFPAVRPQTVKSYAVAAFRILRRKEGIECTC